jgi:hypothetical protein
MRTAKLVGSTGEFVCVVCEISTTEVKLRLLHPPPAEPRLALELPNGDRYWIEKRWERDREAGFRFSTPIVIEPFLFEASPFAKRQIRLRTALSATVSIAEPAKAGEALIRDLSQEGARIETTVPLAMYQRVRLDVDRLASPIFGNVHWTARSQSGVLFQRAFSLEELAGLVWSLHDPAPSGTEAVRRLEVVSATPGQAATPRPRIGQTAPSDPVSAA